MKFLQRLFQRRHLFGKLSQPEYPNPVDTYETRLRNSCRQFDWMQVSVSAPQDKLSYAEIYAILFRELKRLQPETRHNCPPADHQPAFGRLPLSDERNMEVHQVICTKCGNRFPIKLMGIIYLTPTDLFDKI